MINFVIGKPGAGKSLWACRQIVDELRLTKRQIVTNIALKLPDLANYLHERYGETFGMRDRIRTLTPGEMCEFWLYTTCVDLSQIPRVSLTDEADRPAWGIWWDAVKKKKQITRPDFGPRSKDGGCLYVLDEVHEFFGARNWQSTGDDALAYLSQHRKLGDDVICITQAFANVDKQFRSVAQDFTVLRNIGVEKMGWFRLPKKILRSTYMSPPTGNEAPCQKAVMSIDVAGLCQVYDTAAGVGVIGRDADTAKKVRGGVPWQVFVVLAICVMVGIVAMPKLLAGHVSKTLSVEKIGKPLTDTNTVQTGSRANVPEGHNSSLALPVTLATGTNVLKCIGYASTGLDVTFYFNDGTKIHGGSRHLGRISEEGIEVDGVLVGYQNTPPPTENVTPPPIVQANVLANPEAANYEPRPEIRRFTAIKGNAR